MKRINQASLLLGVHLQELGLHYLTEYRFHEVRKWRFDFLLCQFTEHVTSMHIAIEIDGGIYSTGRHVRGAGYQKDLDKLNHATAMGYKVFRFSTEDVLNGRAKAFLKEWLIDERKFL